jgi:4-amino-4-deoxy-L-arabinose transferase-like glycosyltransferase
VPAIEPAPERAQSLRRWQLLARVSERKLVRGLLALLALLLGASMIDESPTTDEPLHLTRGLAYYWGPDTSLNYSHPPLGNVVGALPVALIESVLGGRVEMSKVTGYADGEVWKVARDMIGSHYGRHRPWFFEARAMIALLSIALAFYVYRLGVQFFGSAVGLCALAFFVFHPTLIAHGRLMTTDMPVTVAMVIAVGELVRFLNGGSRWHGAAAACAVGVGMVTKFTGLSMIPLASFAVLVTAGFRVGRYRGVSLVRALASATGFIALAALASLFVINAAYRFERTGASAAEMLSWPEPAPNKPRGYGGDALERAELLTKLPAWMPVPLPYTYVFGLSVQRAHLDTGHKTVFFGRVLKHGHPAYFPVLLSIKTPIVMLAALAYAAFVFWRRRGRISLPAALFAGYAVCLLALSMRAAINIGVRHVLPIMPILAILAGLGAVHAWRALRDEQMRERLAIGALVASVIGIAWSFPDYLSDFNLLVAGRIGGERISIVGEEWGQDTVRLGRTLRRRGIDAVYFNGDSFTSSLELRRFKVETLRFGTDARRLACSNKLPGDSYVAVQARDLARHGDQCSQGTALRTPDFDVNRHVFVFRTGPR